MTPFHILIVCVAFAAWLVLFAPLILSGRISEQEEE